MTFRAETTINFVNISTNLQYPNNFRYSTVMKSLGIEKIPAEAGSLSDYNNGMTERRFSPYADNGGSVVAIAGDDFVVIASDTRLSGRG